MTANTAYTASSHEATKSSFSRRALIGGTAALGAVGLLSACGNGSASSEKTKAAGAGANIEDLYNINAQDVNSLKRAVLCACPPDPSARTSTTTPRAVIPPITSTL